MVNFGLSISGLIGLVQILGGLGYFALSVGQVVVAARSTTAGNIAVRLLQLMLGPSILFLSGVIVSIQGWRLDPILQFQNLLLTVLVFYLIVRDLNR